MRVLRPFLFALVAALLFGASPPLTKDLASRVGPLTLAGLLYLGAALVALPVALRELPKLRRPDVRTLGRLGGAVALGGGVAPVLLLLGLARAPAGSVSLWLSLEGPLTAALAALVFREHLGRRTWLAVALAVWGNALLAAPSALGGVAAAALVAGACLCWAVDNNLTSLIDGLTPAQITCAKGLVAGSVNLALGAWREPAGAAPAEIGGALAIGAVCYGVSLLLYIVAAQQLGAARSQIVFSTSPFLGLALAWTLFGEPVLWPQVSAAVVVAVTIALMASDHHEHEHEHEATTHTHPHRHDDGHHDHAHDGVPAGTWHTHEHAHAAVRHAHRHHPDLHHRHEHA